MMRPFLYLCAALVLLSGCASHKAMNVPSKGIPLADICQKYNIDWQADAITQVVILDYKGNKAKALVGSAVVLLGQEKITLSAPLRRDQSVIYVPEDFESKVISPFGAVTTRVQAGVSSKIKVLVLDAGHGGKDPGAAGVTGVKEKDVVLDIARRMRNIFEQAGITVIMTRDKDEFISLEERTVIASRSKADVFVSIHANSNPNRKTQGMEVYFVKSTDKKDVDEAQRLENERTLVKTSNAKYSPVVASIVGDMLYVHKVVESPKLAKRIVHNVSMDVRTLNRGARVCRFYVVRNTLVPAVLVEVGFLTNRHEEKQLNSSNYRQQLAQAIARSVLQYASDS